ncbi:MAG: thiamine pyrophosphate-dependent enzyme, partial [Bacteroidales bacterium]|nr:thiamine pyrophosphate-dependent enzyme [Bacteroidales bacterium]
SSMVAPAMQSTVIGVGFKKPYMEVSGACAGCGEAPYYRLVSQLFGKDMLVANATGCSSIYCGSTPLTPFVNKDGKDGVAWANSLFEDNAEFGFGMRIATDQKLSTICDILASAKERVEPELASVIDEYLANVKNRDVVKGIAPKLVELVKASKDEGVKEVLAYERDLVDKSVWIVGGDGWSFDIGYGGVDHVLANVADVNILVIDTEVYSNTGGQASKATPIGAIAQFAASGKRVTKKDLGLMQATYGYVYVAQVAMGADQAQCLKAIKEAEAYHGPSLIIAYAPCINHGLKIKGGMGRSQEEERRAVECGYWHLWRYNPALADEGKNPFTLDSKEPDWSKFQDYLAGEVRFLSLKKAFPAEADELFAATEAAAKKRYQSYVRKTQEDWSL